MWCYKTAFFLLLGTQSYLERYALEGDSPVTVTEKEFGGILSTIHWILNGNSGDINF